MKKLTSVSASVLCSVLLVGCANDGQSFRSDVYSTSMVNQAQEVQTVDIIAVMPARIAVQNIDARAEGATAGTILGALTGAGIGLVTSRHSDAVVGGLIAGGAVGNIAGRGLSGKAQNLVGGVQITYRTARGRIFNSAQVGSLCEFKTGAAILVSPRPDETRVQPNNPYGCIKQK